ncbi:TraC family protein [Pyxidicoccus sp. MSG2]|uniref:TraG/VirB4 family ATPase n=1 Tax=Pyxidicoccus sp. MSG2 TaxID=2996790 RepID=UPI00226F405F|nr:TraC family protein [Pyxidicoccus sp. MSG2]MCY1023952.1 TraC family protein [Pyxidicoccus sp. MSG2]
MNSPSLASYVPLWSTVHQEGVTAVISPSLDYCGALVVQPRDCTFESEEGLKSLGEGLRSFVSTLNDGITVRFLYRVDSDGEEAIREYEKAGAGACEPSLREHVAARARWLRALPMRRVRLFLFFCLPGGSRLVRGELGSALPFASLAGHAEKEHRRALEGLAALRDKLSSRLRQVGLPSREMTVEEVRQVHYELLNPDRAQQRLRAPRVCIPHSQEAGQSDVLRAYTEGEQLSYEDILEERGFWRQERRVRAICTLKVLPESDTHYALGDHLLYPRAAVRGGGEALFPFWLSVSLTVGNQRERKATLNRRARFVDFSRSFMGRLGLGGHSASQDIEDAAAQSSILGALSELQHTSSKVVDLSVAVLLEAGTPQEVDAQVEGMREVFNRQGNAELYRETVAQLPVFFSIFPGALAYPARRKACTSRNAADFLPVFGPWRGTTTPTSLLQTPAGDPVAFDFFDPSVPSTHGFAAAATGSGKSFQFGSLVRDARARGYEAILLDNGGSWRRFTEASGGAFLPVTLNTSLSPFESYSELVQADGTLNPADLANVVRFLAVCTCDSTLPTFDKLHEAVALRAVSAAYVQLRKEPSRRPIISDFAKALVGFRWESQDDEAIAQSLVRRLWNCTEGTYAGMLNRPCTLDFSSPLLTFDLEEVSKDEGLKALALATITRTVEVRAARALKQRGALTLFAIDEAHQLLKTPATESFIEYAYRTFRKKGISCWLISQQFNDFTSARCGPTLIENSTLKMVLYHPQGGYEQLSHHFRLTPRAKAALESLSTSPGFYSDFLLMYGAHQVVCRNRVDPYTYWLLTTDRYDNDLLRCAQAANPAMPELELIRHLAQQYPQGWRTPQPGRPNSRAA